MLSLFCIYAPRFPRSCILYDPDCVLPHASVNIQAQAHAGGDRYRNTAYYCMGCCDKQQQ
ncbi:hypothetical protein MPQ_1052 [Methylovorus sp. MP688]|nr:hypothetical protein MPQ_1052 [Methylovorus sp. MP688]